MNIPIEQIAEVTELTKEKKVKIYYPELNLCTDNGAMIAAAGYYEFLEGNKSNLELNAIPNLTLS